MTLLLLRPMLLIVVLAALPGCDALDPGRERARQAELQRLRAEKEQAQEEARRLAAQVKEQQAKIEALLLQLANAKDEATRAAIEKQLEAERARAAKLPSTGNPACKCAKGDPLCTCW